MSKRSLYFILARPSSNEILLLRDGNRLRLPAYEGDIGENIGFAEPELFNTFFATRYGIEVLRRYAVDLEGTDSVFFVLEPRDSIPALPAGACWIDPAHCAPLPLDPPEHSALLQGWTRRTQHSSTMPFAQPGGFIQPLAWMNDVLSKCQTSLTGPVQQIKNAYVSTVFRAPTTEGDVYLKITPPIFVRETLITAQLLQWQAIRLPEFFALNSERGYLLSRDMGGGDLEHDLTLGHLQHFVRYYAQFQQATLEHIPNGDVWPFYDLRTISLESRVATLVDEAPVLLADSPYALNEEEHGRLKKHIGAWESLCREIVQTPLPDTVDHGDLRPGNIRINASGFILYDWAWSTICHPFVGIVGFLHIVRKKLQDEKKDRLYLRDAYLETWEEYASIPNLRHSFTLTERAIALYGVALDAEWLRAIRDTLPTPPPPLSADAWTLNRRQYYYAKVLRRMATGPEEQHIS